MHLCMLSIVNPKVFVTILWGFNMRSKRLYWCSLVKWFHRNLVIGSVDTAARRIVYVLVITQARVPHANICHVA